jgi:hypothetical protein
VATPAETRLTGLDVLAASLADLRQRNQRMCSDRPEESCSDATCPVHGDVVVCEVCGTVRADWEIVCVGCDDEEAE